MQKFGTTAPITAVLDIPAGRIQFIAADRTDTTVEVRPADASKSRDVKVAEQTTVEYADGVLRIVTATKHQILGNSGSIEVTVQLPTGSQVEAKAAGAEFRAVGQFGEVAFEAAQGEIKVDEAASVRIATKAGNVSIGRLNGSGEITTLQGDLKIDEAVCGTVVLATQAGNISVGSAASAALDAGTTVGRVQNSLKNSGETDLTVKATTVQGDITAHSL
ncbi:DUF4097 family beta strand repeat-containing protein [Kribbella italica]|uniref:DUF4097 and DUF4098 domain-containing protein YvlB n=1 Tax=Kribbella italica TaxID=1540520 RepID=A0A7W9JAP9_9ACTN|nr:DUF4097 family beta strand repeat-containing protein [Kribbella italica]MBB5838475.1 DUF4097 and DUF4098 domain-containing protein YvlB [Kribbella italica]